MRVLVLGAVVMLAACDPAAVADFDVHPTAGGITIDSVFLSGASSLGRDFAQRYHLTPRLRGDCPYGAYFAVDTAREGPVGLNLCLTRVGKDFRFSLVEIITFYWGTRGAALRNELSDTLKARYGDALTADITRH